MIDCTESMERHVDAASEQVNKIVNAIELNEQVKNGKVNLALVLYRDVDCKVNRYTLPFTKDAENAKEFLAEKCK